MARQPAARQYTIGQIMGLVAFVALVLGLPRASAPMVRVTLSAALLMLILLGSLIFFVRILGGIQCPRCSRLTIRRLARHRGYYQCVNCGLRVKRYGLGPWYDASGADDDSKYRSSSAARPWAGFTTPADLSESASGTLLKSKREGPSPLNLSPPNRRDASTAQKVATEKVASRLKRLNEFRPADPARNPESHDES
jgi:hypothetical protein